MAGHNNNNNNGNGLTKTISLRLETYERLRRTGLAATTFDQLVARLLDMFEGKINEGEGKEDQ